MPLRFVASVIAIAVISTSCGFASNSGPLAQQTAEGAAKKVAEESFITDTGGKITDYSIHALQHTPAQWRFLVEGKGQFARPGYNWLVTVDRQTGKPKVQAGE